MAQSAEIRHDVGYLSTLPLGSLIAWHRDLLEGGALSLPPGWVECNGQTLEDPESPFHGHAIPNLNRVGRGEAAAGQEGGLFLRGAPRSGEFQQDQLQTHTHQDRGHQHPRNTDGRPERILHTDDAAGGAHATVDGAPANSNPVGTLTGEAQARLTDPVNFGNVAVRHGGETRPVNMSVVWIMKVRQFNVAAGGGLFQQRSFASVQFDQTDEDGAERTVELGFVPRVIWITGAAEGTLSSEQTVASGPVTGFADLEDTSKTIALATVPIIEQNRRVGFEDRVRTMGGVVFRSDQEELEAMVRGPRPGASGFSVSLQVSRGTAFRVFRIRLRLLCMR